VAAVALAETLLAVWLLVGPVTSHLWYVTTLVFSVFAITSAYLGLSGAPSCGCFGELTVNPWLAFSLDVAALVALAWLRPAFFLLGRKAQPDRPIHAPANTTGLACSPGRRPRVPAFVLAIALLVLLATSALVLASPFLSDQLLRLQGYPVAVAEPVQIFSAAGEGEELMARYSLRNISDQEVTVYGADIACGRATVTGLPLLIPVRESREVVFRVWTRADRGRRYVQEARLYIDPVSPPVVVKMVVTLDGR
jgi:hypothetical protein